VRIAWFDCFSGVSGDMCLGALVSAGWPAAEIERMPSRLGLEDVEVSVGSARRGPFAAARVEVTVRASQPHRHLHHVEKILDAADLGARVRERAKRVFRRLAEAEARVHGSTPEKVHFHEVGAADAMIDIAGTLQGLEDLGVERVYSSALRLGRGSVQSEHGLIPVPAPATMLLLEGCPVELPEVNVELVTPTGAALLSTLVESWAPPPPFRLERVGTGAGSRDLVEHPNVLRVFLGHAEDAGPARNRVAVLETSLDDENPQYLAALMPRLLEAGALDAMLVPTTMKKGRPGLWLVAITEPDRADSIARLLLAETTTLGVRVRIDERYELPRTMVTVETSFGPVSLKVATLPDGGERAVPEFESVRAAAERSGRPSREVAEAAQIAWSRSAARKTGADRS
jgi:uncharacterized protein (TIGR00299 family) protein